MVSPYDGFFLLPIICFFVPNNYVQTFFWWTRKQISSNCVSVLDYAGCNAASCVNQKSFKLCWRRNQFPQYEELCNAIMQGGRKVWKSLGPGGTVMRTFQTNIKCNNINHVWSHFYEILVVLKYHRRLWGNIFDTDICRSINIQKRPNLM